MLSNLHSSTKHLQCKCTEIKQVLLHLAHIVMMHHVAFRLWWQYFMQKSKDVRTHSPHHHRNTGQEFQFIFTSNIRMGNEISVTLTVAWLLMPERLVEFWNCWSLGIFTDNRIQSSVRMLWKTSQQRWLVFQVSGSCADGNAILMREVRGEWPDRLKLTERPR